MVNGCGERMCAGVPCLDSENAFILAAISEVNPLALGGGSPGLRAALNCSGPDIVTGLSSRDFRVGSFGGEVVTVGSVGESVGGELEGKVSSTIEGSAVFAGSFDSAGGCEGSAMVIGTWRVEEAGNTVS